MRRSILLLFIGMFLSNGYDFSTWRFTGVLKYFSFSNFIVASTALIFLPLTNAEISAIQRAEDSRNQINLFSFLPETWRAYGPSFPVTRILLAYRYEWIVQAVVLIVYLSLVLGAKAPGCPRGYNGPGGLADNGKYPLCTGGIHRYIDMQFFGYDHIYQHPTCVEVYECVAYDPEGFLGAISACTLTYLGLMSGRVLVHFTDHRERITRWLIWGFFLLLLSGILCGFSQNEGAIPINKNLWSTSFILVNAGGGLVCLSLTYALVDVLKVWTGAPFRYAGLNSILIYSGSELFGGFFPFSYMTNYTNHGDFLQTNIAGVVSWLVVAYLFYRNKFFVKI
jgi:heparan-alpha-glucosaminide N-acetyltransferase